MKNFGKISFFSLFKIIILCDCFAFFALCEANLDDSIDSDSFSVKGYLLLIQKHSSTHMYVLAVYLN